MRLALAMLGVTIAFVAPSRLQAEELAPAATPQAPPAPSTEDLAELRAELTRPARQLQRIKKPEEQRERQRFELQFSGYAQVDLVIHDQASQDEINFSSGTPLNQDRFTLRRGHLRVDAEQRSVSGALEIDMNTTNGPQIRPIDAEI